MAGLRFVRAIALLLSIWCRRVSPFNIILTVPNDGGHCRRPHEIRYSCPNHGESRTLVTRTKVSLSAKKNTADEESPPGMLTPLMDDPGRALIFSILMTLSGAALGPFLDSFHSAFGVLQYEIPITVQLWGHDAAHPALITAWWVPELFGLAGFLIGWLYILFDRSIGKGPAPSPPKILIGISLFTFQYWLSGAMFQFGVDRALILNVMSLLAAIGFWILDGSMAGFVVSAMTALGGPAIEVALLTITSNFDFAGYHYTDPGETGYFPLWILPVYFFGGPANGNLAKGYWNYLSTRSNNVVLDDKGTRMKPIIPPGCPECNDTRCIPCPNW